MYALAHLNLPTASFKLLLIYYYPVLSYGTFYLYTLCAHVTLTFDVLTFESCHLMPLGCNPCIKFELDTTYRYRVRTTTISIDRQLKVPISTFLGVMGSNFKLHHSNPKRHSAYLGQNDA